MGNSMKKLARGGDKREDGESDTTQKIEEIVDRCFEKYMTEDKINDYQTIAMFHHAVCETVQEINEALGGSQLRIPSITRLDTMFEEHHLDKNRQLSKAEFAKVIKDVVFDTRIIGKGAKDILLYIFGVPITALFLKQGLFPDLISNDVFLPAVTSATVLVLAKNNRI